MMAVRTASTFRTGHRVFLWSVEETAPCFIVRDANGQALGSRRIARLPEL